MSYSGQFEPCDTSVDLTFDGVGKSNEERKKHLYPYKTVDVMGALSADAMKERIKIVDGALLKCLKYTLQ